MNRLTDEEGAPAAHQGVLAEDDLVGELSGAGKGGEGFGAGVAGGGVVVDHHTAGAGLDDADGGVADAEVLPVVFGEGFGTCDDEVGPVAERVCGDASLGGDRLDGCEIDDEQREAVGEGDLVAVGIAGVDGAEQVRRLVDEADGLTEPVGEPAGGRVAGVERGDGTLPDGDVAEAVDGVADGDAVEAVAEGDAGGHGLRDEPDHGRQGALRELFSRCVNDHPGAVVFEAAGADKGAAERLRGERLHGVAIERVEREQGGSGTAGQSAAASEPCD